MITIEAIGALGALGTAAALGGLIGGAIGMLAAVELIRFGARKQKVEVEIEARATTTRLIAPVDIALSITTPTKALVTIPVETEIVTAPTRGAELTGRIIAEAPQIGPRALARIFECSTATAQDWYVKSLHRNGTEPTMATKELTV